VEKETLEGLALRDQMRRAVISIMNNIAEGFDSGFKAELFVF